jgi:2-phospho-L-lactate guanylyltransferase
MVIRSSSRHLPANSWAIIPVKPLQESKSRLANVLTVGQRVNLMAAILERTLRTVSRAPGIDRVLVISGDSTVLSMALKHRAMTLDERGAYGLNLAVTRAVQTATENKATAALILPADLPLVQTTDLELMLQPRETQDNIKPQRRGFMRICPDVRGEGTNALYISLPTSFTFSYGQESCRKHMEEAARLGLVPTVIRVPGLEFDLDTEGDWHRYQQLAGESSLVSDGPARPYPIKD